MYKILHKETLNEMFKSIVIAAPEVTRKLQPGQFNIVRIDEYGERIPLTFADWDREAGTVTIVVQEVGKTTMHLGTLEPGDELATFTGPLGNPTEIENYGTVVCVAGGSGIALIYPIVRALNEAGNTVITIMGVRKKSLLFWVDRMRAVSDELIICTDDGSYGRKGVVTEPLKELLEQREGEIARVWAIGPGIMMKFVSLATKPYEVPTIVSLNSIMVDGTGMCGACRVEVGGKTRFACVDGPEFDAHQVNWDLMLARQQFYLEEEKLALERWRHRCQLEAGG